MTTYGSDFLFTGNDKLNLVNESQANQIQSYLSEHVTKEDLVIGSPALIWGLPTMKRADFMTALAFNKETPKHFLKVDQSRYTYDLKLESAKFIILDPLAEEFAPLVLSGMDQWLIQINKWPIVFSTEDIKIFENPEFIVN